VNRVCNLLGIRYPIVEGGLAYVGNGRLAAAISEAGGLGQVGSGGRSVEDLDLQIQQALSLTNEPLGVNVPISEHRNPDACFQVIERYARQLKTVSLSAGNPRPFIQPLHDLGLIVMTLASTPAQAMKAQDAGADIVICEGTEAGGHNGPTEMTTLTLVPQVADVVTIPIIAAGGIGDGRSAAAVMCLGADGIQMGTRFVATEECQAHDHYKQALLSASGADTVVMERSFGRITRVLKSPFVLQILEQESVTPGSAAHLLPMVSGRKNAVAALDGNVSEGWLNCGQSVGFIHDLPSAGEVVRSIVTDLKSCLRTQVEQLPDWG
jgi:NAD(P)H-dependent flavin oxidoreductase YrpB (nitropropane dioxygenase family)